MKSRDNSHAGWISWSAVVTSSNYNNYSSSPSRHWTILVHIQDHRAHWSALFTLNKRPKLRSVPQESGRRRCVVFINLVKIKILKVKWNLYYLIIKYTNQTFGYMPTVLITSENRREKPPRPILEILQYE